MREKIKNLLERLTGQEAQVEHVDFSFEKIFSNGEGIRYNQFNELLLLFEYDRVISPFFDFLLNLREKPKEKITCIEEFIEIVNEFNIISLLLFGNIKFAFKTLSKDKKQIEKCIDIIRKKDIEYYKKRPPLIKDIKKIPGNKTYYLGVYIQDKIKKKIDKLPDNKYWQKEMKEMDYYTKIGIENNYAYLISYHMDVYIATSMREKHEYAIIQQFIQDVFSYDFIDELNLRKFDPTQAFCESRVDKGLTEALMLKRADCTVYLAQETDTFGKDSELATTLAQGKPVIAYVPNGNKDYVDKLIDISMEYYPERSKIELLINLLCIFDSKLIWEKGEKDIRDCLDQPDSDCESKLYSKLCNLVKEKYDKRADNLKDKHPLGIQINLETGVANGVLVVREILQCAKLLRAIILNDFKFILKPINPKIGKDSVYLIESISNSIYRVMTNDTLLTNTFWNFYTQTDIN